MKKTLKFFYSADGLNWRCVDWSAGRAFLSLRVGKMSNFPGERRFVLSNELGYLEMRVSSGVDWDQVQPIVGHLPCSLVE